MKRISLLLSAIFLFAGLQNLQAQCTPNPSNTTLITPDTVTNFVSGTVGQPYQQIIFMHPPDDTSANVPPFGNVTVNITNIALNNLGNLPPGLVYACNPGSCVYPGGVSGCAVISGTPTTPGTYILDIEVTTNGTVTIIGQTIPVAQQDTIQAYRIIINPAGTGIAGTGTGTGFNIQYATVVAGGLETAVTTSQPMNAEISVYDMLGNNMLNASRHLATGTNRVMLSSQFEAGVYIISIRTATGRLTRRFVFTGY